MQFSLAQIRTINIRFVEMRHHTLEEVNLHKAAIQYSLCRDYTNLFDIALQCGRHMTETASTQWETATSKLANVCSDDITQEGAITYFTVR